MTDEDDYCVDEEEFFALTDSQQEAVLDREMRAYNAMLDNMTPCQLYEHRRKIRVDLCLKQRRIIKEFPYIDMLRKMLKDNQRGLLAARIAYRTGREVGNA